MGKGPKVDCSKDEVRTQQSQKDDADINVIVDRARRGAALPEGRQQPPIYADFTEVPTDLREALVLARRAEELFMAMDPYVRRRFDNDPMAMLDFLNDPRNREEAVKLGLVKAPVPEKAPSEPEKAPVLPEKGLDDPGVQTPLGSAAKRRA